MKVSVDNKLLEEAQRLSGLKTKEAVVENALNLFVILENQKRLKELWGKIAFFEKVYN